MAMFFTKEKFIFDQWKFSGDLLTFSEPSSFWISLIVSLGMHTFAFNCFKMTKLTSFRQHLFEDDRQTFTAVFISLKIFIITSLSKINQCVLKESVIILRAEITVVFLAFFYSFDF